MPGWFLLLAIFGKNKIFSNLEKFVFSFGLSLVGIDFLFFLYSKFNISITRLSSIVGILIFLATCLAIYQLKNKFEKNSIAENDKEINSLPSFSKNQFILILLLIFFTFFIKTAYLSGTILPTATDFGHHLYWANWMAENNQLPTYEGMPDFIIGEHIIFGLFKIIGNLDFFSAFPPLILLLINILSILTVFLLVFRVFKEKMVAILVLLFLGVFYAVSSPQAKFVSGGVIGNILGNFLVPLSFYFYYRSFEFLNNENVDPGKLQKIFLSLAIFTTAGLFYTHHLTAFIFLFIFALMIILFLLTNFKNIKELLPKIFKLILSPQVLGTLLLCIVFFFFIFTPTYIQNNAVQTAVGTPSKNTRVGLSLETLKNSLGEARLVLGFLGILILGFFFKRRNLGYCIIAAWAIMLFIMSCKPGWIFINLPSDRIGNYLSYPLSILSAFSFFIVFKKFGKSLPGKFIKISFLMVLGFVFIEGVSDSADAFKQKIESEKLIETFAGSKYLAAKISQEDSVIKDHVYLVGDAWIKLFFMREYKYPLSRSFLKRYEDPTKPREMCTLYMISNPGSTDAKKCFEESGVKFIMLNPVYDSVQFLKLKNFNQVYLSKNLAIYYKAK